MPPWSAFRRARRVACYGELPRTRLVGNSVNRELQGGLVRAEYSPTRILSGQHVGHDQEDRHQAVRYNDRPSAYRPCDERRCRDGQSNLVEYCPLPHAGVTARPEGKEHEEPREY